LATTPSFLVTPLELNTGSHFSPFSSYIQSYLDPVVDISKYATVVVTIIPTNGSQVPTIAAINGHAFAGGFMLSMACDYRVMTDGAKRRAWLSMNEVSRVLCR
jgi:hypothetical protein